MYNPFSVPTEYNFYLIPTKEELSKGSQSVRPEAEYVYKRIKQAEQQGTYPIYYSENPHYKTRSPKFQIRYSLRFVDRDDFEIISFSTDEFPVSPFQDNILEGKIDVGYKNLEDFKNEVFDKTKKVFISIQSAHL